MVKKTAKVIAQVKEKSQSKPMAVAIYDKMPEDLQTEIDTMVDNYTSLKELVLKVVELGKKYDFTTEELSVVVKFKLAKAGISSATIFRQLAQIEGEKKPSSKAEEDAKGEAKSEVEQDIGYIDMNLAEIDVDAIIQQLKINKKARIYYSKVTNEFVKIEFIKK